MKTDALKTILLILCVSNGWICGFVHQGSACGLEWVLPKNHFDGANEVGNVSYWEEVATVEMDEGLRLPVFINFNSARESSSAYLGKGWIVPLLESRFEQVDENSFKMIQPDGITYSFTRVSGSNTILSAGNAWKAEMKGDTITAKASCGWELDFSQGHLVAMITPKRHRIEMVSENGKCVGLREDGQDRLRISESRSLDGTVDAFYEGSVKLVEFTQRNCPWVENVNGKNVIGGFSPSLNCMSNAEGIVHYYNVAVTEASNLPKLEVSSGSSNGFLVDGQVVSGRNFVWNPVDKSIVRDGTWEYKIQRHITPNSNCRIERTNARGINELWDYDADNGRETTRDLSGTTVTRTWFISGMQAGQIRKISRNSNGKEELLYQASYDDQGRLIRQNDGGNISRLNYAGDKLVAIDRFGKGVVGIQCVQDGPNKRFLLKKGSRTFTALVDSNENILEFHEVQSAVDNTTRSQAQNH